MTSDAKRALAKTIRELREKLILPDLREATERAYQLVIDAKKATLSEAARAKREDRLLHDLELGVPGDPPPPP